MGPPLDYRNAIPDLSSSSPLHNMTALSSSPPISPHSPTPQSRTIKRPLDSPSSSNPHPFSGSAKAGTHSHPSFGRGQIRSKHLRGNPEKAAAAGQKTWVLTAGPSSSSRSHVSALAPSNDRQGRLIEDALGQHFFDSSDDSPSSDWNDAMDHTSSTAPTSIQSAASRIGLGIDSSTAADSEMRGISHATTLGLDSAFQENTPTSSNIARKAKVRTFSRTQSSSQDPFSAGAGSSYIPGDQSPRSQRQTQRRRLTGSSPKKLTRSRFDTASFDNSSDEDLPPWEEMQSKTLAGVNWENIVEQVFEKVDGSIELTRQGLTRIDPIVADLSKFVSIPHLRRDSTATMASPSFSRIVSSNSNPFERSHSLTSAFGSPNSRKRPPQVNDSASNSNLQMFLASNHLQIFPSAFFELQNLVVLTIRDNGLQELPPAIGQLINLRELNVSQNELQYLPAEIQKLRLNSFLYFPNPFDQPDEKASVSLRLSFDSHHSHHLESMHTHTIESNTSMGPPAIPVRASSHARLPSQPSFAMAGLVSTAATDTSENIPSRTHIARSLSRDYITPPKLPSLIETCTRVLLEPEEEELTGSSSKILLEDFESGSVVNLNKSLDSNIIRSLEAARRSAVKSWGRIRLLSKEEGTWCSGVEATDAKGGQKGSMSFSKRRRLSERPTSGDFDEARNEESAEEDDKARLPTISIEEQLDRGDDVRNNPWFNRCPNSIHYQASRTFFYTERKGQAGATIPFDWPGQITGGRIFNKASVERLEWVSHVAGIAVTNIHLEKVASSQDLKTPKLAKDYNLIPLKWRGCGPHCLDFLESPHVSLE